jgi:uncharacterized membrane protein YfcA
VRSLRKRDGNLKRLAMAMGALAALGVLTWSTIEDERIRYVTLAILALFAVKTWLRRNDTMHGDHEKTPGR